MKRLYISESEKYEILRKHNSKILSEITQPQTNYTIQDLQNALIKAGKNPGTADNQFGVKTLGAIEQYLGVGGATTDGKGGGTTGGDTTGGGTTPDGKGGPNITNIETKKVTSINTAPTPEGIQVQTKNVGGGTPSGSL
jgi:hypothetical protein